MQLKDDFVRKAKKILHVITKTHQKKHKVANQVENLPKAEKSNFVYVGIHCRRTDHIEYEKKHQMRSLDAMYYLDAMHLYRKKFKKENSTNLESNSTK